MQKYNLKSKYDKYDFKDHSQSSIIKILFPFSIKTNKIFKLKKTILKSGKWFALSDILITESSRHFDHIESLHGVDVIDYTYDSEETHKLFNNINDNILSSYMKVSENIEELELKIANAKKKCEKAKMKGLVSKHSKYVSKLQKYNSKKENYNTLHQDLIEAIRNFGRKNDFAPVSISIIVFSTGVFFLNIEIGTTKIQTAYSHSKNNISIKKYFKALDLEKFIKDICGVRDSHKLFKSHHISTFDKRGDITTRFQVYCDVKYNQIMPIMPETYLSDTLAHIICNYDEHFPKKIAYYYLDRNSENNVEKYESNIKKVSIFPNNKTFISSEGVLLYSEKRVDNVHSTSQEAYLKNEQNAFFSYILVLHQYYALHSLARDVKSIGEFNQEKKGLRFFYWIKNTNIGQINKELSDISLKLSILQAKFIHKVVSQFVKQQELYSQISNVYGIKAFVKEVNSSVEPLDKYIKSSRSAALDFAFKALTLVTVSNAILSIWMAFNNETGVWDSDTEIFGLPTLPVYIIVSFLVLFILWIVILTIKNSIKINGAKRGIR